MDNTTHRVNIRNAIADVLEYIEDNTEGRTTEESMKQLVGLINTIYDCSKDIKELLDFYSSKAELLKLIDMSITPSVKSIQIIIEN